MKVPYQKDSSNQLDSLIMSEIVSGGPESLQQSIFSVESSIEDKLLVS